VVVSDESIVLGQRGGDHVALRVTESVEPPNWTEPAIRFEVTTTPPAGRFRTFEALIALEDLQNFLAHLHEAEADNTVGGFLHSANQELTVKLRGQGTGTFDLDCEISDNPEVRKPQALSLVLYPSDLPRVINEIEAVLGNR